jgi:hypothetical protein
VRQILLAGMPKNSQVFGVDADFPGFLELGREGGSRVTRKPTEAHPTNKLAGTPIRDHETVAKMGHPKFFSVRHGPPARVASLQVSPARVEISVPNAYSRKILRSPQMR